MSSYLYTIAGRVQKVGFRMFIYKKALELGIDGYTKNLSDGQVEVLASFCSPEKQKMFEEALRKGPAFSKVKEVKKREVKNYAKKGFDILLV